MQIPKKKEKELKKKYTVMIFDESKLGDVKTKRMSLRSIKFVLAVVALYIFVSVTGFYILRNLTVEKEQMLTYKAENDQLKTQITGYASQLDEIDKKIVDMQGLEQKVRSLASYSKTTMTSKELVVGAKEIDNLQELYAVSERKQMEFLDELDQTLKEIGGTKKNIGYSYNDLTDFLGQEKLVTDSVPSIWPTVGWVSSKFGYRISPFTGRRVFHEGLDIANRFGTPIRSTAKGIVLFSGEKNEYGNSLTIDHGFGYITRYSHCSELLVNAGDLVEKGQLVAKVGNSGKSTGPHLHYEIRINGLPVNPMRYILREAVIN